MILGMLVFFIITIGLHQLGALVIWTILEFSTRNFHFRNSDSSDPTRPRYPTRFSLLASFALISPFLIPGYPIGDVANYELLLSRMGWIVLGTASCSLYFGARFKSSRDLKDIFLAIVGILTSGVALFFLFTMAVASPV